MKKWYVGVDGGGTKTAAAISLADGTPLFTARRTGCSYRVLGTDAAAALIADIVKECLASVGASLDGCAGCCLGIPCVGENPEQDAVMSETLRSLLAPAPLYIVNDVEVGWAGALERKSGIHIVAGTGSIAFGKDPDQNTARCGGWSEFFGDEGSAYWVGREAMSLLTKQADGRLPRGALYEVVHEKLGTPIDTRFIDVVTSEFAPYRDRVAAFQMYAYEAAKLGDEAAIGLYGRAAHELALLVRALKNTLHFPAHTDVSYSGGLFHTGELLLGPLSEELSAYGCALRPPAGTALDGALMLSIERFKQH